MSIFLFNTTGIFCSDKQAMNRRGEVVRLDRQTILVWPSKEES